MLNAAEVMTAKLKASGVILCGDFNSRHTMWGDVLCDGYGKLLFDKLDHNKFAITTSATPTFLCEKGFSFIDLMIVSKNIANIVESCVTNDEVELFSGAPLRGHVPLIMEIAGNSNCRTTVTKKLDVQSVNWEKWSVDLEKQIQNDRIEIENYEDPEELWEYTDKIISKITKVHGKMKKSTKHSKPYWTSKLTTLCNKMREARKAYKIRNTDARKQALIITKDEFDKARKIECEKFIMEKTKSLNAANCKKFWKEFNKLFKKKSEQKIDPLEDGNGGLITDNKDIEEQMFATFFECRHMSNEDFDDVFCDTVNELYVEIMAETDTETEEDAEQRQLNSEITVEEIKKAIKSTDPNKISLDNHQMHPQMLHHFGDEAINLIQRLFNLSMNKSKWVWREAEVIFLKKEGKSSYAIPGSYRPISITSYLGKLLEKIIAGRIINLLFAKNHHDPNQEAFTKGGNPMRYLNRLNLEIKSDLMDNKTVIGFFVDMEKAFDSVWKKGLIVKLWKLKIRGKVLRLINSFLTCRIVKLNINGMT